MYSLKEVRIALDEQLLSKALYKLERFAKEQGLTDLANWAEWELNGYPSGYNKVNEEEEEKILKYRKIDIQWKDIYGRSVIIDPQLAFVQKLPMWIGVAELEGYSNTGCSYTVPGLAEDMKKIATGDIGRGWVPPESVQALLKRIRLQAHRRLDDNLPIKAKKNAQIDSQEWSWKKRLIIFFGIFGTTWTMIEPLFAAIGEKGPLSSWGIWRYPALLLWAFILTVIVEIVSRAQEKDL